MTKEHSDQLIERMEDCKRRTKNMIKICDNDVKIGKKTLDGDYSNATACIWLFALYSSAYRLMREKVDELMACMDDVTKELQNNKEDKKNV